MTAPRVPGGPRALKQLKRAAGPDDNALKRHGGKVTPHPDAGCRRVNPAPARRS